MVFWKSLLTLLFSFFLHYTLNAQLISINEVKPIADFEVGSDQYPWIEIKNQSDSPIRLSEYSLRLDEQTIIDLPNIVLDPKKRFSVLFANTTEINSFEFSVNLPLKILPEFVTLQYNNSTIQTVKIPQGINTNESYGKYPENSSNWIFFPSKFISLGKRNPFPGPWQKITQNTGFSPRDSSPNASVYFDNKIWVLAGWRYIEETNTYESHSDVYHSDIGVDWILVNSNPPYNPYSSFVSFKGWIWALSETAYRSKDGVIWENLGEIPITSGGRTAVLDEKLYWIKDNQIWTSDNGTSWILLSDSPPWSARDWPGLVTFQNKLWLIGGGINYNTEESYYYNDIWNSPNGVDWTLINENADWPGRYWFSSIVFDEKMWILGGWNYFNNNNEFYGNQNDIWYTEDGVKWTELITDVWPERHAMFSWINEVNEMFVSSGYGGGGRLYNDVWRFRKENFSHILDSLNIASSYTYGDSPSTLTVGKPNEKYIEFILSPDTVVQIKNNELFIKNAGTANLLARTKKLAFIEESSKFFQIYVGKKDLFVSVKNKDIEFGSNIENLDLSYEGFTNNDTQIDLHTTPTIISNFNPLSPAGKYEYIITGGQDDNYSFRYENGFLEVIENKSLVTFPIPASSEITFASQNKESRISHILIYSRLGKKVGEYIGSDLNTKIDISYLEEGIYNAVVAHGENSPPTMVKFIVVR